MTDDIDGTALVLVVAVVAERRLGGINHAPTGNHDAGARLVLGRVCNNDVVQVEGAGDLGHVACVAHAHGQGTELNVKQSKKDARSKKQEDEEIEDRR